LDERRPGSLADVVKSRTLRVITSRNSFDYYLYQGEVRGYQVEMVKALVDRLNREYPAELPIHFEMLPMPSDLMIPMLLEGRGDMIAARLTVTPARAARVRFSRPYHPVEEWVVGRSGSSLPTEPEDLAGQRIAVRAGSSHADSLIDLNRRLKASGLAPVELVPVDEVLETEDLLALVAAGRFDWTVADSIVAELAEDLYENLAVVRTFSLRERAELAWAVAPGAGALVAQLDAVLPDFRKGTLHGNIALRKYFRDPSQVRTRLDDNGRRGLSPYDALLGRYAESSGFDWRLLAAIAYQESRFRADAHNSSGAVGLFQIKPETAAEPYIGISDIAGPERVEANIEAATKYLAWIKARYFDGDAGISECDRLRMTMAAYNAGPASVRRARQKAAAMQLDDTRWFRNVEMGMLAIGKGEPVKYVGEINRRFVAYKLLGVE
jgi:membrane-bound lytic murein transglycosylase MltF